MENGYELLDINENNVDERGFFCYMSKRKAPGYQQKRDWLEKRFAEGMKIKILHEVGNRDVGFIEYIPGEYAWRAVHAPGYLVIHCLWVVGKGKGKGYGSRLLQECLDDARRQDKHGVVMVSSDRVWLAGKQVFLQNGFIEVDQAPPFQLLVHRFNSGPDVAFPTDWERRQESFGTGFTVVRTPQCPYVEDAVNTVMDFAEERGIPRRAIELTSSQEIQERSPSPYGIFGIVLDGKLLSYYYLLPKDLNKLVDARQNET
jgi:GNAT superfamily N-acetyltransferase